MVGQDILLRCNWYTSDYWLYSTSDLSVNPWICM